MSRRRFNLRLRLNVNILIAATIIYCLAIGYISWRLREIAYTNSKEIVKGATREYRNKISEELNVMMESARTMNHVFSAHKKYEPAQRDTFFENILFSTLEKNPDFLSTGLYWEIKALDEKYTKKNGRIRTICYRSNNQLKLQKEILDTTNNEIKGSYYKLRELNKETLWNPYYDLVTKELKGTLIASLFVPIQNSSGKFEGLVGIDITLSQMNKLISGIMPFEESVSYVVGGNHMIIAHTNQSLTGKSFIDEQKPDSLIFHSGLEQVVRNKTASFTYVNSQNQEKYFVSYEPILIGSEPTDWIIGVEVPTRVILKEAQKVLLNSVFVGFIGLILLFIVIYLIGVKITTPIVKGVDFAKTIASGNLNTKLDIHQNDEIGDLAESLSLMASKLTSIMSEIIQSSDTIAEGSLDLMDSSVKLADGANNQAASSEEISTSMELMLSRIQQNTKNAQKTERIAIKAAQGIQEGNESTKALIKSMNNIVQKISIVGEIAKQTNLLAINASIEASRYGMQGKGFGVVAAEIKKLAERSQQAAKEINELSTQGILQAKETENKLLEIIPDIEQTANLVKLIAASSLDQKISSEEINQGIQQLNKVTQQNAESSFELSINSKSISAQAKNLKKLISYFKIEGLN
ncbi:MAG: methyl-accepting chemotaxis protein [Prolixibacteraceae bacterium]|nr:methyl-accepting chemotaxis protein [Prolixibacteraceae bacterium]